MQTAFVLFADAPWHWVSMGMAGAIRTRVIRTELAETARIMGLELTPDIFADIRVLEDEALTYWSRKR